MKKVVAGIVAILITLVVVDFLFIQDLVAGIKEKEDQLTLENSGEYQEAVAMADDVGLQIGKMAPDFTLNTHNGNTITLSELKGKKVLLNFWASWCGPCEEEMPAMQKVYNELMGQDVEIVAVNMTIGKETIESATQFVKQYGLTFPVPLDTKGEVMKLYEIYGLPTSYFLDSEGIIRAKFFGPMDEKFMKEELNKLQ
ncbi:TlpA family protein disulfide reductase [Bacillus sp. P1(2020)]|uniref:TlpA family protein disulfide reductase n=2 Tax=Pallidibacillus pasinlerensis TaxID=2703818 RepID=A0ABX0A4M7_9BACI|nr:TlpA family protein disulfide reductase [Pallidibacillus pasinlerensis]